MHINEIIVVTGGRDVPIAKAAMEIDRLVKEIHAPHSIAGLRIVVYHGDCPKRKMEEDGPWCSVDYAAGVWAANYGYRVKPRSADWHHHGKRAGMIRNIAMVNAAYEESERAIAPIYGIAIPGPASVGTWHCVRYMRSLNIDVRVSQRFCRTGPALTFNFNG